MTEDRLVEILLTFVVVMIFNNLKVVIKVTITLHPVPSPRCSWDQWSPPLRREQKGVH